MDPRLLLHSVLVDTLGSEHVYYQPPANVQMVYPCIVYKRDTSRAIFADNNPYRITKRYMVTVIDPDPDSDISEKVERLPLCQHNRSYVANNLNHDVFTLYF